MSKLVLGSAAFFVLSVASSFLAAYGLNKSPSAYGFVVYMWGFVGTIGFAVLSVLCIAAMLRKAATK